MEQERELGYPFFRVVGQKSVLSIADQIVVHSHRRTNRRNPEAHILQSFTAAFPTAPGIIGQGHDSNVHCREVLNFCVRAPWNNFDIDPLELIIERPNNLYPKPFVSRKFRKY